MKTSVLVGNPRVGSRTLTVAQRVLQQLVPDAAATATTIDLAEHADVVFDMESTVMETLTKDVTDSTLVIVASPTYKASYTGLLKAFLDRYPNGGLSHVCAVPVMTGGSAQHSLAPETTLRPLLSELGATITGQSLYVNMSQFEHLDDLINTWSAANKTAIAAVTASKTL